MRGGMAKLIARIEQEAFEIARGVDEGGGDGHGGEDRRRRRIDFRISAGPLNLANLEGGIVPYGYLETFIANVKICLESALCTRVFRYQVVHQMTILELISREKILEGAKKAIEELLLAGASFTYKNFATKSQYGNAVAFSPEWVAWRTRVIGAIGRLFEPNSAPVKMIRSGDAVSLIGNGEQKFDLAKSYYVGGLKAALQIIDNDTFGEIILNHNSTSKAEKASNKVFIVHGHDEKSKQELEIILIEMGLEPIVLHRQADSGRTLIEKFEHYSDVGFAFILMTPDEVAYLIADEDKSDQDRHKERRARPNVIFEFGFFVGRLGRGKTCCLYRGDVTLPSDLSGLIYKRFDRSIEETAWALTKELKAAGYNLK